ncbi:ankyrin repeat-containing domain protein [Podospora aff. communis PSN243]|uniref:Ankyrin repeat-containing domain protein n=1 Tax=Podospora aff. communis PSN243 TaxID=3040156 RepID=A0AAV9GH11_9PEZI|nr:ankyrin repeat-containing domain protein [Podospora aff. communis PSN243]
MDPISATAGAIAFVQAATAIAKGLSVLRSLENAPAEFQALLSELQALQTVASQAKISASATHSTRAQAGLQSPHADLSQTVDTLDGLTKRLIAGRENDQTQHGRPKISRVRWRLEKDNIYHLRDRARSLRECLSAFFVAVNAAESSSQSKTLLDIGSILQSSSTAIARVLEQNVAATNTTLSSLARLEQGISKIHDPREESGRPARSPPVESVDILRLERATYSPPPTSSQGDILGLTNAPVESDPHPMNALDDLGYTPLHWAVRRRDVHGVTLLLASTSDTEIRDRNGRSPVHLAARAGLVDITAQLLRVGSNPNARDINGKSPLHLAVGSSEPGSTETTNLLLRNGSFPNLCDSVNQFTPLNHLVHSSLASDPWDSEAKIESLLKAGADIDLPDKFGCSPPPNARVIHWDDELFKVLYTRGAKTTVVDRMGRGLLHYIAAYGDLDRIEYLRAVKLTGIDPCTKDFHRHTPESLISWRHRTLERKLWTNMKRPSDEEVVAFGELVAEINARNLALTETQVAQASTMEEADVQLQDSSDNEQYLDAVESHSPAT